MQNQEKKPVPTLDKKELLHDINEQLENEIRESEMSRGEYYEFLILENKIA